MTKKFSAFTAASSLTGADQFVGLQAGDNVRSTLTLLFHSIPIGSAAAPSLGIVGLTDGLY